MIDLFFSYAHEDEALRNELEPGAAAADRAVVGLPSGAVGARDEAHIGGEFLRRAKARDGTHLGPE